MDPADFARLVDADRRAVDASCRIVDAVRPGDLDRPTPCTEWRLGDLLTHMVANNHGWVAAAHGQPGEQATWEQATLGDDPAGAYRRSAAQVIEAFAQPELIGRELDVYGYGVFSAPVAVSMHFVDFLVHGWDVARSLGNPGEIDEDLAEAALAIALRWPYRRPDKAFHARVPVADTLPASQQLVAYLGRSPSWPQ